ncbi:hypothetical protein LZ31DRAFT_484572 [Colletotrichum somersetense]|nr:hypothetical protein LZ31DRAFT_484572 [Colletotrichum somersetense]
MHFEKVFGLLVTLFFGGRAIAYPNPSQTEWEEHERTAYRLQIGAVDELKVISQPPGVNLAELPGYGYADEGGKGQITVPHLSSYPALWGLTMDIIVVGAVTIDGRRAKFSQGNDSEITVSAPGYVTCADGASNKTVDDSGTSYAAPAVAGVIAVWLSQKEYKASLQVPGRVAANVKKMIQDLAYPRVEGGPRVIWNGIDPRPSSRSFES